MSERVAQWLRDRIRDNSAGPGRDPMLGEKLAEATESIWRSSGMVFGMVLPARFTEREALLAEATAALQAWLPLLEERQLQCVAGVARRASLPIDCAPHLARVAAVRDAARAEKRSRASASEPRNEALERAIEDRPDDPEGYSVLADWLEAQGSPRGALIHMSLRGDDIAAYVREHRAVLLGATRDHELVWRRGYVHAAKLSSNVGGVADDLLRLLLHPSSRWIRELAIGMNGESQGFDLEEVIEVLAGDAPATLRSLHLGDFEHPGETEMSWYSVGDASTLWARLPQLTKLIVQGGSFTLGALDLPALEHAEFRTGGLTTGSAVAIATAKWPKLRHLDVWYGSGDYDGTATLHDIRALLARRDLGELRHLGLMNAENSDAICELLVTSPLSAQLEVLDLSMGTLGDEGVGVLLAHREAFPKLQRIDISRSFVSDEAVEQLKTLGAWVIFDDMNEPEQRDDRFVSVGE